jgi:hypothetical protein
MKTLPDIAQGDSFALDFQLTDADDTPIDIQSAIAQVRAPDHCFLADLTWTPDALDLSKGVFSATPAETTDWPVTGISTFGPLAVTIQVTDTADFVQSVEPLFFTVLPGVTQNA